MKILYGGFGHGAFVQILGKLNEELSKLGIEFKAIDVEGVCVGFLDTGPRKLLLDTRRFRGIVDEFKPDFVITDNPEEYFGLAAIREGIPLLVYLRGDYWRERRWAIAHAPPTRLLSRLGRWWRIKNANECFRRSSLIMPISRYLDGIVRARFPKHPTAVVHHGIDPEAWQALEGEEAMDLRHPCVGFVQNAFTYEKTAEMLVLSKVMKALPEVTFYWAGDGPHRDAILPELSKHDNFGWLGNLNPSGVKRFLASVDVYGLASGLDMLPSTVLEAEMARRPVIATRVGGVPEMVVEGRTGLLVDKGDHTRWVEHIEALLGDEKGRRKMGAEGRQFVEENFTVRNMARQFSDAIGNMYSRVNK